MKMNISFFPDLCKDALGIQSRAIPDSSFTASLIYVSAVYAPHTARLNSGGASLRGWAAKQRIPGQWLQVDLLHVKFITGLATQGCAIESEFVKSYSLQYSLDGIHFNDYQGGKVFSANTDSNTAVRNDFLPAIRARYIRIVAKTWKNHIVLRIELYGCT